MEQLTERVVKMQKWDAPGDYVEGILIGLKKVRTKEKKVAVVFVVQDADGAFVKFFGTADINEKLSPADLGCAVRIEYRGEDQSVIRNGNALKRFGVFAGRAKVADVGAGLEITDEDIPF
jgi:hypothetical protein